MEPNSPKKIQFAVPLFQSQLDPEASEQIRKRRPTPASLVILNEHTPSVDDKRTNSTNEENVSPRQRKQSVFTAPAMKGAEQAKSFIYNDNHQSSSMLQHITVENSDLLMKPRRKDTPYPLEIPFIPAVKQIKKQNDSPFPEEEEDGEDEEEVCDH
ncbi:protein phosphatase 1 regulatory inhibitor subunit 1C L homeolog isoform X2 [Xenopus laevis]|uniref:Protein phosphatase 1 regulatory inhibitor subunit 1C L homeolog isoform X2 n=1 Tax=Xenopus laevis TaxID=8355 RepID=A0A8J1LQ85_XENLA|nr:protein phosphatase 1 regulatory inhibitor subunit 1C L homeolog isoform X2 [Xenopus laevis]